MKKWIRRIALGIVAVVAVALVIGASTEAIARRRAARDFPPPGKLVDIGGRRLQLDCRGTGSPTVVLESGLDTYGSLSWAAVHDSLAATTRTCAYSRAGVMWSDPADGAFDGEREARDLHELLAKGGEHAPYVMVGHSLGGPYIMIFTRQFGADVAGLVFVDASHPDQVARIQAATGSKATPKLTMMSAVAAMSWSGVMRLMPAGNPHPTYPAIVRAAVPAYLSTSLSGALKEAKSLEPTLAEAGQLRQLGARPLVVLTATKPPAADVLKTAGMTAEQSVRQQVAWKALHDDEASWSTHSRHELVPDATHYIQFDRPDVVIRAVREVVADVRAPQP